MRECKGHNDSARLKIIRAITRITMWNESEPTTVARGSMVMLGHKGIKPRAQHGPQSVFRTEVAVLSSCKGGFEQGCSSNIFWPKSS